jgi:transcriptional regulator with XRE-family HTH domain
MVFDKERSLAELALNGRAAADLSDIQRREWPPAANRIREARLRTGLSEMEVARRLSMTVDSYDDIEWHDDEAFTVVSLKDLAELGRILNVHPRVLLFGPEPEGLEQIVTFREITSRLTEGISKGMMSAEQLGELIGWDIKEVLRDPDALWGFTVEGLYEICKAVGLDWVAAIPSLNRPEKD